MAIQTMLADGYAPVQIKEMLHTTYSRIRRYATGDPSLLCRFQGDRISEANQYRDEIIKLLMRNASLKHALDQIATLGYKGKRRAFEDYCHKLITELDIPYMPRRNIAGASVNPHLKIPAHHYVSKKDFMRYLWSGKELEQADIDYIFAKHPNASEIQQCIVDFRKIFDEKSASLLEQFIERYRDSHYASIKSFASGLSLDFVAVKNAVTSELSNGFVEGINNKIKAIKRMMYGRAKIDLLRVKVIHAR